MTKLLSLLLALVAGQQAAAASLGPIGSALIEKRQGSGMGGMLGSLLSGKGLSGFLGEPEATETLTSLARILGASKTSPGSLRAFLNGMNKGYGIVAAPPGSAPRKVISESRIASVPTAKTIKIRYGPYTVPSALKKNGMGQNGMLFNFPHENMEKPCSGECTMIGLEAGLEFPDGTNANIDNGLWLHHLVLFAVGPGREDFTCSQRDISIPHISIGATSRTSERIFASGNERTRANLPDWGVADAGYKLKSTDKFSGLIELMNQNAEDKVVWLTMTYDIVDGHPYKDDVRVLWLDIRQCGTSEANPPKGKNQFTFDYQWKSTIDGEIVGSIEHLHDGGAKMTLAADNQIACDSKTLYGTKPEFVSDPSKMAAPTGGHSHGGNMKHISEQAICHGPTLASKEIKKGQNWELKAVYDFDTYKGMQHEDGAWDEVMGIAIMFIRFRGQ